MNKNHLGTIAGIALLMAGTSARAAAMPDGTIHLRKPVTVAGHQLPEGDYRVKWDGSGPEVEVKIMNGKKVLAATHAKIVTQETPSPSDSVLVDLSGGGRQLSEIRFSGKKEKLQLENEGMTSAGTLASH